MKALILVDIQNDFLPGGALAVPGGDAVIPVLNSLQSRFPIVVATQDWHPANHGSFVVNHPGESPVRSDPTGRGCPDTLAGALRAEYPRSRTGGGVGSGSDPESVPQRNGSDVGQLQWFF